jgi:hypothetical protein
MRSWQVERRKRTRHVFELGGLVVKAGIVELPGDQSHVNGKEEPAFTRIAVNQKRRMMRYRQ